MKFFSTKKEKIYHKNLELEYEQTNENIRLLTDIRFKLLAFIPPLGGVAAFALSFLGFSLQPGRSQVGTDRLWAVALIAAFGFMATLAITIYDQRNSELYNALIHRAKYLEELFESKNSPGALRTRRFGGQFQERPERRRRLFGLVLMGHDLALAFIYGSVLGAWFFPLSYSLLRVSGLSGWVVTVAAASITLVAGLLWMIELVRQDREDANRWKNAGRCVDEKGKGGKGSV